MGMIFDIQRYAIHDGPGIRTTVFLKGCPLNCTWCHNPEGKAGEQEFMWWKERCMGCRDCQNACPQGAISFSDALLHVDRRKCTLCGACEDVCHAHALELVGREMTVAHVMKEIVKDTIFYDESGGGVTLSGGEPLMQPDFTRSLLETCKELRIHTALDTCGYGDTDTLLGFCEQADLFLYDVKAINDEKHVASTGVSNKLILQNLRELSQNERDVIVRYPLIPSLNDDEKDIQELGAFVASLRSVKELHVLPYHRAGVEKSQRLRQSEGGTYVTHSPSIESLAGIEGTLRGFGLKIQIGG